MEAVDTRALGPKTLLEHAARWLQSLVDRGRRSDGLWQSPQTWEAQYAAGKWGSSAELPELSRFSILAGYICHLKPGGAVLDVGCGPGVLLRRLPVSWVRIVRGRSKVSWVYSVLRR